jgi:hypothetical protein
LKQKQRLPHNIDIREAFLNIRLLGITRVQYEYCTMDSLHELQRTNYC